MLFVLLSLPQVYFECIYECAGYFVSRKAVVPVCVEITGDPVGELLRRGVELRFVPDLWHLRDRILRSSLNYSLVRMRNALPGPMP